MPRLILALVLSVAVESARADDPIFRYEGDVLPYADGGFLWGGCVTPCSESVEDGRFVLRWGTSGRIANYTRVFAQKPKEVPDSLWVEWRFRSNVPIPRLADDCDARFSLNYRKLFDVAYLFGDAIVSFSGDDYLLGLALDEFHTYRFESPDGVDYWFSVDGLVFYAASGDYPDDPFSYIQFGGRGGCGETRPPDPRNEWDYIRYGTIGYGEAIAAVDPPGPASGGFLDARVHAPLDRFTVTYDEGNFVYVDEVTVQVSEPRAQARGPSSAPSVTGLAPGAPTTFAIPTVTATR